MDFTTKWHKFKKKFKGPLQEVRGPLKDPERFQQLAGECNMYLVTAVQAPGHNLSTLLEAAKSKRDVKGVQIDFGNFEKALKISDQLIEMEPLRGIPWTLRAQALIGLERLSEALAACERAIQIDPSDPDKWALKGTVLRTDGKENEAAEADAKARELRMT